MSRDPRKSTPAPARRKASVEATPKAKPVDLTAEAAEANSGGAPGRIPKVEPEDDKMVTVTIPNAFTLQTDYGRHHRYEAGITEMPLSHAEHDYAVANGVEIYKPSKK